MLLELSYPLSETAPKWPTNPDEKYYVVASPENGDVNTTSSVYHHMHNGTHFDAPRHFDPKGQTIDELPVEDFYYTRPFVLKLNKQKGEMVTLADIRPHLETLADCDILFIYTGYSQYRAAQPEIFMNDFPYISAELAAYIRKCLPKLKAVAVDTLSVDSSELGMIQGFPSHHALLETCEAYPERTLRVFEDVNISLLLAHPEIQSVCALPVRWAGLEAGPVGMLAVV